MKLSRIATTASGLALAIALAGPVMAEGYGETESEMDSSTQMEGTTQDMQTETYTETDSASTSSWSAEELAGTPVVNSADEEIGEIEAIVRDSQSSELYAVVAVGGYLGIGDKEVPVPLSDLEAASDAEGEERKARIAATKEELEAMPEFDESMYQEVPAEEQVDLRVTIR